MPKERKISSHKRSSKRHRFDHKFPVVTAAMVVLTSMETVNPPLGEQGNTNETMAQGKEEEATRQINKDTALLQHAQGFQNALMNTNTGGGYGFSDLMHVPEWRRFPGEMMNGVEGEKDNHHHHNDQQLGEACGWLDEVMMEELLRGEDCSRHAGLNVDQGADPISVFLNSAAEWF